MRTVWSFSTAGQWTFGRGAVGQLGDLVRRRGLARVLLVTDRNLVDAGLAAQAQTPLAAAGVTVEVFAEGQAEPATEVVDRAVECARRFQPDSIMALGGGSNIDVAKVAATVYTHGGVARDYFGFDKIPGPILPLIAVPTTAGTGSEVSHAAVLTDVAAKVKVSSLSHHLRPVLAVVDPTLTYRCPRPVTAASGIDALTHAIEAYTAVDFQALELPPGDKAAYEGRFPFAESLAEQAITQIGRYLVRAVDDGDDHEARDGMAFAATLAGMAFSNAGVALVHALEYPLGAALHCSHGVGNGLLLPHVMRFNAPVRQAALVRIAALLGENVQDLSESQAAEQAIVAVERINREIGIPARIRDLGGTPAQLPGWAEKAFALSRLRAVNPRPSSLEDLTAILHAAF
jgi:alcohol dehydrogenase class IV